MNIKEIMRRIGQGTLTVWQWLKPYLVRLHQWRKRIWKKYQINKIFLLMMLVVVLVMSIYLFILAKSAKVEDLKRGLSQSTIIYDGEHQEAGKLYGQKGTFVEFDDISTFVKEALVATEDKKFYTHKGYDLTGIGRALFGRLTMGRIVGGGSTIAQQLAKNAYLTQEQTFDRKAKELFLAIEIEKKYSKEDIMTMYLNNAYFGNRVWGIEDASKKYFGVSAGELSVGEAATLVGMLKGPGIYNPIEYPENAKNRRDTVLQLMVDNQKLTQEIADEQASIDVTQLLTDAYSGSDSDYRYPAYFDAVIDEVVNLHGISEEDILNKGYKIYTALDQNYQQAMDQTYLNERLFPPNAPDGSIVQSGSVAMNPKTGGVQALVGRRGEHVYRGFNFATQAKRSPGSSLKPIVAYVPALESGYRPDTVLPDVPQDYYPAENYSRTYAGEVPMYQALGESLNLPVIWLLHEMGLEKGFNKTEKFGISLSQEDMYYGLGLGGLKTGVSPLVMANAYSVFANDGRQAQAHLVNKIVDASGAVIVENTQPKTKQIITERVAAEITSMLLGVFSSGSGINASPNGFVMAGKTGTTETSFDGEKTNDQWVIGYTPDVVIATWLGFEETSEEHYLEGSSATYASTVFNDQANGILPYTKLTPFTVADAYATAGKMMTPGELETSDQSDWTENIHELKDKVQEGTKDLGDRLQEGAQNIGEQIQAGWEKTKEGAKNFIEGIFGN